MHFLSDEDNGKGIEDYVERATAWARQRVEHPEATIEQEQDDMTQADIAGMKSRTPE
jgi:hypothetical protein